MRGHDEIPLPPTALLAAGSAALLIGTLGVFSRHRTTVDPTAPEDSRTLVTSGANKVTRNPMYLAMVGLLIAHATWRGSWQAWLPAAAFAATMDRFQIPREERALREPLAGTTTTTMHAHRAGLP